MRNSKLGMVEAAIAMCLLVGAGATVWSDNQSSIARLEVRMDRAEIDDGKVLEMFTSTHEHFTQAVHNNTKVMIALSVSMANVDARLGGVEEQLKEIRLKI